jgi:DNA-binding NarL/FixJ family response regulator
VESGALEKPMEKRRILIIDDHPLFRDALKQALAPIFDLSQVSDAANLNDGLAKLSADADVDLVLLDLKMPGVQGLAGLALVRSQYPSVPVVIVSGQDEPAMMRRARDMGAAGFVPKATSGEDMRAAFKTILAGGLWFPETVGASDVSEKELDDLSRRIATLTPQQLRVLMMLKEGQLNKQIAYELDVSEATIKAHVSAILTKLNVDSRTQAVIAAGRIDGDMKS